MCINIRQVACKQKDASRKGLSARVRVSAANAEDVMSFTSLAILGFSSGLGAAALVSSLMTGYFAARRALSEV